VTTAPTTHTQTQHLTHDIHLVRDKQEQTSPNNTTNKQIQSHDTKHAGTHARISLVSSIPCVWSDSERELEKQSAVRREEERAHAHTQVPTTTTDKQNQNSTLGKRTGKKDTKSGNRRSKWIEELL
jgi:hypothetical protein